MKKRFKQKKNSSWVPFLDTSIFPDIISFRHVQGVNRLFLQIEIILGLLVVIGTCILILLEFL